MEVEVQPQKIPKQHSSWKSDEIVDRDIHVEVVQERINDKVCRNIKDEKEYLCCLIRPDWCTHIPSHTHRRNDSFVVDVPEHQEETDETDVGWQHKTISCHFRLSHTEIRHQRLCRIHQNLK